MKNEKFKKKSSKKSFFLNLILIHFRVIESLYVVTSLKRLILILNKK